MTKRYSWPTDLNTLLGIVAYSIFYWKCESDLVDIPNVRADRYRHAQNRLVLCYSLQVWRAIEKLICRLRIISVTKKFYLNHIHISFEAKLFLRLCLTAFITLNLKKLALTIQQSLSPLLLSNKTFKTWIVKRALFYVIKLLKLSQIGKNDLNRIEKL